MDNLDFLIDSAPGNATIFVTQAKGTRSMPGLNTHIISQRAPILALGFEEGARGPTFNVEGATFEAVICLLRYIYLGDYKFFACGIDQPCSQLIHFELYRFGELYSIPELCNLARLHTHRETELACSLGRAPPQLAEAVDYLYTELYHCKDLREVVVHYCVNCFYSHGLGESPSFRKVATERFDFHRDLLHANILRDFQDDSAQGIIQLPDYTPLPSANFVQENEVLGDFLFELLGDSGRSTVAKETSTQESVAQWVTEISIRGNRASRETSTISTPQTKFVALPDRPRREILLSHDDFTLPSSNWVAEIDQDNIPSASETANNRPPIVEFTNKLTTKDIGWSLSNEDFNFTSDMVTIGQADLTGLEHNEKPPLEADLDKRETSPHAKQESQNPSNHKPSIDPLATLAGSPCATFGCNSSHMGQVTAALTLDAHSSIACGSDYVLVCQQYATEGIATSDPDTAHAYVALDSSPRLHTAGPVSFECNRARRKTRRLRSHEVEADGFEEVQLSSDSEWSML